MTAEIQQSLYSIVQRAPITCVEASKELKIEYPLIVAALKSLEAKNILKSTLQTKNVIRLTPAGERAVECGTPEFLLYKSIPDAGIPMATIADQTALPAALRRRLVRTDTSQGKEVPIIMRAVENAEDDVQQRLKTLESYPEKELKLLKKAKFVEDIVEKYFYIELGTVPFDVKQISELTIQDVQNGLYGAVFKPLNLNAKGKPPVMQGALHPLLNMRTRFVEVLTSMGFQQMDTSNYVEASFWNFDALFQPQQHPARDMHDTFFVKGAYSKYDLTKVDKDYHARVVAAHEKGYNYVFDDAETSKNIMRTHTTAVSARMLYNLAQTGFRPIKCFSIDRVFRNETLDATHLCEFHYVEGFVCDRNLSLANLMGTIKQFFTLLNMPDVRFKPTYNPYTEPSMEIFCYHAGLKRWIEVGNSGMFRPEMLRPMGLPDDVQCIAWGLSLERPTMIKYAIDNIRDLIGPGCDLGMISSCVDCRIE